MSQRPAIELAGAEKLSDPTLLKTESYVGGRWTTAENGTTISVSNPADGGELGAVANLSAEESAIAIDTAHAAFRPWAARLPQERSTILRRWFELMQAHKEDLATIMTLEQGKPISESRGEIDYAASFLEFYAEEAKRPNIESVTSHLSSAEVEVWLEPLGVAALITPWNFPCAMLTRKAGAALAAGCTVVAHPSHETPFSALALAELGERAGIPAGVFNLVTGGGRGTSSHRGRRAGRCGHCRSLDRRRSADCFTANVRERSSEW